MGLVGYDAWKTTPPDEDERENTRCPHGEDRPDDCNACNREPCDVCMELWRAGFGEVPCSICNVPPHPLAAHREGE